KALPSLRLAQAREQTAQPIVIELGRLEALSSVASQQQLISRYPLLNFVFRVIGLRKDEGQPDGQHPSATQSGMRSVISNLTVVKLWNPHLHQNTKQQGNSVKSDVGHGWGFVHDPNNNASFEQRRFSSNLGDADKPSKQMTYGTRIIRFSGNSISGKLQSKIYNCKIGARRSHCAKRLVTQGKGINVNIYGSDESDSLTR